ncbi:MAG TPA: ABC transporter ATP-binding protein [Rhabdochlamydiaceae bacterium]|nr:ABC transporter ATP-binding protein [Rhabdochlamydiaceae bacterium]
MKPILKVHDLVKIYPGKPPFKAVDQISFDLKEGEILGLLGPNGAGKTTTIHMLLGTLTYSSGSIAYFGTEFKKNRHEVLQHVAFASTYVNLPWMLTIDQNLEVFGRIYGLSGAEIKKRSEPLLERFGIASKRKSKVTALSAGQLTRLILVKAFLVKPKIALLDEPTASLDPDMALEVCKFIQEQRKQEGTTMLFTSHKMDEVAEVCDRVLFLQHGKIIADDIPQNLVRTVSHSRLQLVIVDGMKRLELLVQKRALIYKIENRLIEIQIEDGSIAPFLMEISKADISYSTIRIDQPNLEDYFLKMAKL